MQRFNINWTAKSLSNQMERGKVNYDNAVQRNLVWDVEKKSLLVHSMIYSYMIPAMYFTRDENGVYDCLDFKQRYMACAGTSFLLTFATAAELNEWFDAQVVEDRHLCRLYDRVRMVHILGYRYMWLKPEEQWTDDPQSSFPSPLLLSREEPWN